MRLLGALLAPALACAPACTRTADPTAPPDAAPPAAAERVLVLAHTSTLGRTRELFDLLERDFEAAHPGVDVRQAVLDDDDYQKFGLLNLFSGSTSPDIYFQWGGFLVERDARAGYCRPLDDLLARSGLAERFIPERWFGARFDGKTYLLPQTVNLTVAIFYNRAIFAAHGIAPPASWADLVAACRRLRAAGVTPIVIGNKDLWMGGNWAAHIASRVVGEDVYHRAFSLDRAHRFDAPQWIEALERVADLVEIGALKPGAASLTDAEAMAEWLTARAAMIPIGDWLVPEIARVRRGGADLDYGFFNTPPLPGGRGDPESVMAVSNGYLLGSRGRHPELAWELLEMFFDPARQAQWVDDGIISPVRGASTNAAPEVEAVAALTDRARRKVSPPDTGYSPTAWSAFYDAVQQVLSANRSPAAALAEAERYIEAFEGRR